MTLTKSWLQKAISDIETMRDGIPFGLDEDGNNTLAALKLALAGMEAVPVGVTDKSEIECLKRGEMANVMPPDYKGCDVGDSVCLYDGPQPLTTSERAELENYRNAQPDMNYQHLSELYHAQEKRLFKLAQRIKGPAFDKYAHSPSQAIDVLESAIFGEREDEDCRAAMLQAGNSPVIPDCWCRTCRPVSASNALFIVCPDCGNKRCPHANDHRNVCTGSNDPGQQGSAYPAAPQQEAE